MSELQRAVIYAETGGPEVLKVSEVTIPEPAAAKVIVRVRAVGLNPFESKVRSGVVSWPTPLPRGIGGDFAGVVSAVGEGAAYVNGEPVAVGDEVLGFGSVTLREYISVPAKNLARKPADLPWEVAGSLATPGLVARASVEVLNPGPSDTVFVSAAAGAVGSLYCQLALRAGARVIGSASPANHERLRELGVEPVAYGQGLAERLREVAPEGITAVQDNAGGETIDVALELGVAPERICELVDNDAIERLGLASPGQYARRSDVLEGLAAMVADGTLSLAVQQTYPLEDVAEAYRVLETRHLTGKIVVLP